MKNTKKYGKKADLALSLLVKLARATDTMAMITGKDIEGYGLTPSQFSVFEVLGHLGPMLVKDIGAKKLMSGGNLTVVIDNLEKQGLVERAACPTDRRATYIRLTEKGQKLFDEVFVQHAKCVENLIWSVLNEEEITQLSALLKKLGLALKEKLT
jgi:MarR family 2-MHQ and catechol resistance regulon transcriptional repressor